jgi:hypothetical protein
MFFGRFMPTFPVLHRGTFVFRECTQPLLLNAMAIGSLYLGPKNSIAKVTTQSFSEQLGMLNTYLGRGIMETCPRSCDHFRKSGLELCKWAETHSFVVGNFDNTSWPL